MLHVNGNKILDENNAEFQIKGISMIDIGEIKEFIRDRVDIALKYWNINTIRLPVYPPIVPGRISPYPYLPKNMIIENVLMPTISYAEAHDLQVIVDWHQIAPLSNETVESALVFWREALPELNKFSNVIVEVYNEPSNGNAPLVWNSTAPESWTICKPFLQTLVSEVRSLTDKLIICPTPAFCRLPLGANADPLGIPNVAYSVHTYPPDVFEREGLSPFMQGHVDFSMGVLDQIRSCTSVPLVLTEVGFPNDGYHADFTDGFDSVLKDIPNLSWVAWVLDPKWWPPLLTEYNTPSVFGKKVKALMK